VVFGFLFVLAANKQTQVEKEMVTEINSDTDLRQNVEAFMRGEPVSATEFPWFDSNTQRVRTTSLEVALNLGEINQEEFDAFHRIEMQWKRVDIAQPQMASHVVGAEGRQYHSLFQLQDGTEVGTLGAMTYLLKADRYGFHEVTPTTDGYTASVGALQYKLNKEGRVIEGDISHLEEMAGEREKRQ
jgi:hypothetical protein